MEAGTWIRGDNEESPGESVISFIVAFDQTSCFVSILFPVCWGQSTDSSWSNGRGDVSDDS